MSETSLVPRATFVMLGALVVAVLVVELGWRDAHRGRSVEVPVPRLLEPAVSTLRSMPPAGIRDAGAASIASGVIFGRTEHVTVADQEAFLSSGLWHLLAASGQNIALVAVCALALARAARLGRVAGTLLALVAIPAYVMVVGGGASIVRAGVMGEVVLLAWLSGRLPDVRHLVIVAATVLCWIWPGAHRGLGMQLSFACVAGLAWLGIPAAAALNRRGVPSWLAASLSATAICSAATAPILLLRTGSAPLAGTIANVVAVPLAGVLLIVGLAGAVGAALASAAGVDSIGPGLLAPAGLLAQLLQTVAHRAAAWPAAQTTSPLAALVAPLLGLAAAALRDPAPTGMRRTPACVAREYGLEVLVCDASRIGRARAWSRALAARLARARGPARRAFAVGAAASLGLALVLAAIPTAWNTGRLTGAAAPVAPGWLRVASLDVGQGDATLLATSEGAVLIDAGPPDGRVVDRIRALGVTRLDGIVLTHDSLDHRGGFERALALKPSWMAQPRSAPGTWGRYRARFSEVRELCAGDGFSLGDTQIDVLHPRCDGAITPRTGDLPNDGAMVLLVRHGSLRMLLPADAEAPVLTQLGLPRIDLLRVSHHGSRDDQLAKLVATIQPQLATISVGAGNSYGHPAPEVLATLAAANVTVLRTDRDGTIALDSDGDTITRIRAG